jgi:hypothetical protein
VSETCEVLATGISWGLSRPFARTSQWMEPPVIEAHLCDSNRPSRSSMCMVIENRPTCPRSPLIAFGQVLDQASGYGSPTADQLEAV